MILKCKNEFEVWKKYLLILSSCTNKGLTNKESEVLAFCLTQPLSVKRPLYGNSRKQLKSALNMKEQTLAMHKKNMQEKASWLIEGELNPKLQLTREKYKNATGKAKLLALNFKILEG